MQTLNYNEEIKKATAQILDVFANIRIDRIDFKGNTQKEIKVPCVYGGRSRILKSLENRGANLKPPIIALLINSITKDNSRVHSVNDGMFYQKGTYDIKYNIGTPIDITYDVSILTVYQDDMDQILSNFIVNFNPSIYVVWDHPYGFGTIKSKVVWNGNINLDYNVDIDEYTPQRIMANTTFTLSTWLFPKQAKNTSVDFNHIHMINISGSTWYDTKTMTTDAYYANVVSGLIEFPNYDRLGMYMPEISGNYWIDVYGILSANLLNPKLDAQARALLTNINDPNGFITSVVGYLPHYLKTKDWTNVFRAMVSGELSAAWTYLGENDTRMLSAYSSTKNISALLYDTYNLTSDEATYEGITYGTIGELNVCYDQNLWQGAVSGIPTSTLYDIIFPNATLEYNPTSGYWAVCIYGKIFIGPTDNNPVGYYTDSRSSERVFITNTSLINFFALLLEDGLYMTAEDSIIIKGEQVP